MKKTDSLQLKRSLCYNGVCLLLLQCKISLSYSHSSKYKELRSSESFERSENLDHDVCFSENYRKFPTFEPILGQFFCFIGKFDEKFGRF